jgi:hypothetical protein
VTEPATKPVVLRLAAISRRRSSRDPELQRIFTTDVHVETIVGLRSSTAVLAAVEQLGAVAVLADLYPVEDLEELRVALEPVPVLRPVRTPRPGVHAGGPEAVFAHYARLGPANELLDLADGELA